MSSSLKQRKGSGAVKLAAAVDDEYKEYKMASTKAVQSMKACYKTIFFATFVDVFITFIDNDLYQKFYSTTAKLSWVDYFDVFDSMSLLVFACGLWRLSVAYQHIDSNGFVTNDRLVEIFQVMIWIWGINALNLGMISVSVAASLPAHAQGGLFGFLFTNVNVSSNFLILAVTGILACGNLVIRWYCNKNSIIEDQKDNARIHPSQQQSKGQVHASRRELGYQAYLNQCLCAGSFGIFAILKTIQWVVDADDGGVVGRLMSCSDVLEPFAMTMLLMGLNRSFLRAAIARLRDEHSGSSSKVVKDDDEIYNGFFAAQSGFYNKISTVLKGTSIFQLLPYAVAPFLPFLSRTLKLLFPSIYAEV
eukprot:CAMPEP_0194246060 /NCGR_PEP_ID=MMETSP0158-20130606/14366_1 /TAXON_ID=33649 /ORGANISM="Thalassionema nitzschioides, Strain L26-B" /LENGTH=361 /DNA_ID=CAMNT_0038981879 /DNA_START=195 /DNA_END=1276 /DNA_ORIENTATION=-